MAFTMPGYIRSKNEDAKSAVSIFKKIDKVRLVSRPPYCGYGIERVNIDELSLFGVSVGSTSALALLGFLLTCQAYKIKFTAGGKLWVRYGHDIAGADL